MWYPTHPWWTVWLLAFLVLPNAVCGYGMAYYLKTRGAWEKVKEMTGHSIEAMSLEEAGADCHIIAATTGGDVLYSTDAGESWRTVVSGLAPISKGGHFENMVGLLS